MQKVSGYEAGDFSLEHWWDEAIDGADKHIPVDGGQDFEGSDAYKSQKTPEWETKPLVEALFVLSGNHDQQSDSYHPTEKGCTKHIPDGNTVEKRHGEGDSRAGV